MNHPPPYTEFHPRWHRDRVSTYWWLKKGAYFRFILRELSSVFIGYWIAVMLALVYSVGRGAGAYEQWQQWMTLPVVLAVNTIALFFVLFHAVTWFNLAPKALKAHLGKKPVPGWWIAASNYAAWAVVSLIVILLLL